MTLESMRRMFEDGILRIEWQPAGSDRDPRGYMDIVMREFFPARQWDITKLHKAVMEMYWSWWDGSGPDPVWPRVREWMKGELDNLYLQIRTAANQYVSAMTDMHDLEQVVREKKYPDGRPVTAGMMKKEKFLLQEHKSFAKDCRQQYDALQRRKKKLEENIRFISNWQE